MDKLEFVQQENELSLDMEYSLVKTSNSTHVSVTSPHFGGVKNNGFGIVRKSPQTLSPSIFFLNQTKLIKPFTGHSLHSSSLVRPSKYNIKDLLLLF
jgi:hypothetical protein